MNLGVVFLEMSFKLIRNTVRVTKSTRADIPSGKRPVLDWGTYEHVSDRESAKVSNKKVFFMFFRSHDSSSANEVML
jgi:hypothetical protein